ncbi:NAD-dependent epimerase/dehydratase family protein, partial [Candidatus Roizmanbacteria bacterium]|nr:NAD-dependent epimerase/dehydratase family protein [Candidatus Roizmanbacteria bacterium]
MRENGRLSSIILEDCKQIIQKVDFRQLRNKNVLLTGSNGFFGRYIAYTIYQLNKLKKLNCTLFCVSLHGPNKDISLLSQQDSHIKPIQKDLSKNFKFNQPVDFIMHAACYAQPQKFIENSLATIELNITSTRKLLELAKKYHARFMFFSSA